MLELTDEQWRAYPKKAKGMISSAVKRGVGRSQTTDDAAIGLRTLKIGNRVLVEGIGFVITDESLV